MRNTIPLYHLLKRNTVLSHYLLKRNTVRSHLLKRNTGVLSHYISRETLYCLNTGVLSHYLSRETLYCLDHYLSKRNPRRYYYLPVEVQKFTTESEGPTVHKVYCQARDSQIVTAQLCTSFLVGVYCLLLQTNLAANSTGARSPNV